MFFGDKVMLLDLTKNNMAALNNERLAKIWNPGNVMQTHDWKLWCGVSYEKHDLYSDTSTPSEAFKGQYWMTPLIGTNTCSMHWELYYHRWIGMGLFRDIVNSGMIYKREIIKSEECHPHTCTTNILWVWSICWDFFVNLKSSSDAELFMSWT